MVTGTSEGYPAIRKTSREEQCKGKKETGPKAADFSGVRLRWISVASRPVDSST
jgi:hypothetical protein